MRDLFWSCKHLLDVWDSSFYLYLDAIELLGVTRVQASCCFLVKYGEINEAVVASVWARAGKAALVLDYRHGDMDQRFNAAINDFLCSGAIARPHACLRSSNDKVLLLQNAERVTYVRRH